MSEPLQFKIEVFEGPLELLLHLISKHKLNINDIPMLQAAGHDMAMINAESEDREAADAITEYDNDHDGVARTIMAALA